MAGTGLSHAVGALRIPAYRWWFLSQIMSASGSMTQAVAQSWLVLQLTRRAVDLGILAAGTRGPGVLGGGGGGAGGGRGRPRRPPVGTPAPFRRVGAVEGGIP